MKRLVSGIKPTGELTLGNYIGALKQFVDLQNDYECFIFVADLHAITTPQDSKELKRKTKDIIALYLACGLDPNKVTLFLQSENVYHPLASWMLECHSYLGELNRMTQYKDKISKGENNLTCGLFTYPVLMAADILLYDADVVPVGIDQKQHVELTRNIAERFNNKYGHTFKIPTPIIPKQGEKIKDLQDPTKKMSKSEDNDKGCIMLLDDLRKIEKKIMSAVTDSDTKIIYDEENKPGISNLITIYASLNNITIKEVEEKFHDSNYGTFKKAVADVVLHVIKKIQDNYNNIINSNVIEEILDRGKIKTSEIAKIKTDEMMKKIGLGR